MVVKPPETKRRWSRKRVQHVEYVVAWRPKARSLPRAQAALLVDPTARNFVGFTGYRYPARCYFPAPFRLPCNQAIKWFPSSGSFNKMGLSSGRPKLKGRLLTNYKIQYISKQTIWESTRGRLSKEGCNLCYIIQLRFV